MKYLLFTLLFLSGSLGFAASWNKTVLTGYGKAKSYKDLFCSNSLKAKSCKYYEKSLGKRFSEKPLQISMTEEDTIWVHTAVSQIKVVRESENKFQVNGHRLDLAQLDSRQELRAAVRKSLPKQASLRSLWISSAWAVSLESAGVVDLEVVATIDHLIVQSKKLSACEDFEAFVKVCVDNPGLLGRGLGQTEAAWKGYSFAEKEAQIKVVNEYLVGLRTLAQNIKKNKTQAFDTSLKACSKKNPPLGPIFKECVKDLEDGAKALGVMNQKMDEQVQQFVQEQERTPESFAGGTDEFEEEYGGEHEELEYVAPAKVKPSSRASKSKAGTK